MLVYPDSSDLIRLENADDSDFERLEQWLHAHDARLVLSRILVKEVALPMRSTLTTPTSKLERLLDRLVRLPLTWLREVALSQLELEAALRCFTAERPWEQIEPFAATLFDTLEGWDASYYRQRPLIEYVRDLLPLDRTNPLAGPAYKEWLRASREAHAANPAAAASEWRAAIHRDLMQLGAGLPKFRPSDAERLVQHIWAYPDWCPGTRLTFQIRQLFIGDKAIGGCESDVEDLIRIKAVPYVDVFITDVSKVGYLNSARSSDRSKLRSCSYWKRCHIFGSLEEAMRKLS